MTIQYLRAIAAVMVVVFHLGLLSSGFSFVTGNAGVDMFFVISGFVMYLSGRKMRPARFALLRLIRIVPLYWAATLAFVLLVQDRPADPSELLKSLFFVTYSDPYAVPVNAPVLSVGWTLNLEMMFYALFAAALVLPGRALVPSICFALLGAVVIGSVWAAPGSVAASYTAGIILEFGAGLVLGLAARKGWLHLPPPMAWSLLALGLGLLAFPVIDAGRVLTWGLPAVLIVAAAVGLEPLAAKRPLRWLVHLGDASYALYLCHMVVIPLVFTLASQKPGPWWIVSAFGLCLVMASAVHLGFERPVTRGLRRAADRD